MDNAIQWIKQFVSLIFILWKKIYAMDSTIQCLNNRDLVIFAQYVYIFINFDLPMTDYSLLLAILFMFFLFRIVAGIVVGVGGGGGSHPDPEKRGRLVSKRIVFSPSGLSLV